jgi:hypothetical protein
LKEEALDHTMWRAGFGKGFGPVVRQTAKWINDCRGEGMFWKELYLLHFVPVTKRVKWHNAQNAQLHTMCTN